MNIFSSYFSIFLSLSLSFSFAFLLATLINSLHNLLLHHHHHHHVHFPSSLGFHGSGLLTGIRHAIVKKLPPPPQAASAATEADRCDVVGAVEPVVADGLASCTESLGFESCVEDPIERLEDNDEDFCWRSAEGKGNWRRMENSDVRKKVRSFPPPLSSLNPKGQPNFFLRPVRKNGRLELTEVRIHRPEILRARRRDGRLTLFLVPVEDDREDESEQRQQGEEEEKEGEEETAELGEIGELEDKIEEKEEEEKEQEEKEKKVGFGDQWKIGENEGLRSCHEVVNHHRRNVLPGRHYRDHGHRNHPLHVSGLGIA